MKVGITGADGFLGFHVRAFLHGQQERFAVRIANRATFQDELSLDEFVGGLDAVIHCAGMNRGDDTEIEATNRRLADALVGALQRTRSAPAVVFANSTHVDRGTPYGRGKRAAAEALGAWGRRAGTPIHDVVLPHVFGEFGKPFYNSVVSTFCHQLARGETPRIDRDGELELVHAQAVVRLFMERVASSQSNPASGQYRMTGERMIVSELLGRLERLLARYTAGIFPDVGDGLDRDLFNTLRSYLFPDHYPRPLHLHTDNRGALFEAVKADQGGQTFLSWTHPGITRGNHYHRHKIERFLVLRGEADIRLRKLFSDEVITFRVAGSQPAYIDMPTFHAHSITNVGAGELQTLFWANEIFDPGNPDTYAEIVST